MTGKTERQDIIDSLGPLFTKADTEGLWFRSYYQGLWFSPAELRERQAEGKFVWGPANWDLRNPEEKLKSLEREVLEAQDAVVEFSKRMGNPS